MTEKETGTGQLSRRERFRNGAEKADFQGALRDNPVHGDLNYEDALHRMPFHLFAHLSRVELYVRLLCFEMAEDGHREVNKSDCLLWGRAAFFHDIGKIRVPRDILTRPEKLPAGEDAAVREHPRYGKEILMALKPAQPFSKDPELFDLAVAASLLHHEWWNGAGYPLGLAGQDIPLIARMTSICDAFDAITYGRPYRKARSADAAYREIKEYAGSQFDPVLSRFFVEHGPIFLRHADCFQ
ncbi:MAG: HD domain-containing phosphohydrolase [Clostridiaceae bacterium]|nr:HD domain-containing protein [Eubacteriales bacterium]